MFTGIVEERGEVRSADAGRLVVVAPAVARDAAIGGSIAVSGTCLTVVERTETTLTFDLSPETLVRTRLGRLRPGDGVNMERPLTLAAPVGGHLVQGHVDGVGRIAGMIPDGAGGAVLSIKIPGDLVRFVVEKGSITVDGVSLTVAAVRGDAVEIALIPHTLAVTSLGVASPGDPVNIEIDMIARYVATYVDALAERS